MSIALHIRKTKMQIFTKQQKVHEFMTIKHQETRRNTIEFSSPDMPILHDHLLYKINATEG